jgi:hypothetical protein
VEYIDFNPLKQGYVEKTADWKWLSFYNDVENGIRSNDWGDAAPANLSLTPGPLLK